ncbi:AAA family ATPase [Capnocytophaga cynodegmi]|uniref:AAA family ATPase n=1 Tax=Capnocytophaga cynodegmi TaxID=28189 RepID=UPI00385CCB8F
METTEKLKLKNFGPIKELDIEIKPLMVFIGESGSGKSAILKLMSLLRWVHKQNNLANFFQEEINKDIFFKNLQISEIKEFISEKTEIVFDLGCAKYQLKNGKFEVTKCYDTTFDKVIFLSENRGILPNIFNQDFSLNMEIPYHLEDTFFNFRKAIKQKKDFFIESTKLTLFEKKAEFHSEYFIKGDDFEMKFKNASSGTKNASFLELIVNYIAQEYHFDEVLQNAYKRRGLGSGKTGEEFNNPKNLSVFIEEPELSLFPSAQRRLINRLIKDCFVENKQKDCTTRLAFATHSPYIVNHLNLLMEAFDRENTEFTDGASISYDDLGIWLIQDGKLRDLKYRDRHFIDTMILSDDINEIYNDYDNLQNG